MLPPLGVLTRFGAPKRAESRPPLGGALKIRISAPKKRLRPGKKFPAANPDVLDSIRPQRGATVPPLGSLARFVAPKRAQSRPLGKRRAVRTFRKKPRRQGRPAASRKNQGAACALLGAGIAPQQRTAGEARGRPETEEEKGSAQLNWQDWAFSALLGSDGRKYLPPRLGFLPRFGTPNPVKSRPLGNTEFG